jgi:hypothetical protein
MPSQSVRAARRRGLALLLFLVAGAIAAVGVTNDGESEIAAGGQAAASHPPELPRGGRSVLPEHRVVAYYGAPQSERLGILGIGTLREAGRRLERQANRYALPDQLPVLPAMELIAVVASNAPEPDGKYRYRQTRATIRQHLAAARKIDALLILDIQPGRADFVTEARALSEFLVEPDVGLALDPEWRMGPNEVPGRVIGSVDTSEINAVTQWLAAVVKSRNLPDKLVVIHQFTDGMIARRSRLRARPGIDLVLNADGFGSPPLKLATYRRVTRARGPFHAGFKLFFEEDTSLMSPTEVMRLRPLPHLVIYE